VVIAIIGILAAMVFPVFARARESARKVVCLSNVKNIALAVQMYLSDYDRMPPSEHRQDVIDFYACAGSAAADYATRTNPYLRLPVILDEYVRNRDVWRCPSARTSPGGYGVNATVGGEDWFVRMVNGSGAAVGGMCPIQACQIPFPPGWNGDIMDAFAARDLGQDCRSGLGDPSSQAAGFVYNYNGPYANWDIPMSQVSDPVKWLVIGENGPRDPGLWNTAQAAYPDYCMMGCASCSWGPGPDWEGCPSSQQCGAGDPRFGTDASYRKEHARHVGGVNLGFADGHAKWFPSEAVLTGGHDLRYFSQDSGATIIDGPIGLCAMPDV
jgi:prepilin-type processing-associated H-X9-DG protein